MAIRRQILDVARKILHEEGVAAITARRVGRDVGLSRQAIHYHFSTMADLQSEVITDDMDRAIAEVEKAIHDGFSSAMLFSIFTDSKYRVAENEVKAIALRGGGVDVEILRKYHSLQLCRIELIHQNIDKFSANISLTPRAISFLLSAAGSDVLLKKSITKYFFEGVDGDLWDYWYRLLRK